MVKRQTETILTMVLLLMALLAAGAPLKVTWQGYRYLVNVAYKEDQLFHRSSSLHISPFPCIARLWRNLQLAGNTVESSVFQNVLLFEVNYTNDQITSS